MKRLFNLRNTLILLGLILSGVGIIYFATEFIDRLSDWGRVASLGLLATIFVALGRHFETLPEGGELLERKGWHWLRLPTVLYVLGLLAGLTGVIVFLGIDEVDRLVKAAVAILGGLLLILWAAKRYEEEHEAPE